MKFGRRDWRMFASGWMSFGALCTLLDGSRPWWWAALLLVGAAGFALTPDNWHAENNWQRKANP